MHFLETYADYTDEQVQSPLSAELQAILRCLSCGSTLESDQAGGCSAPLAERAYPYVQGIARFCRCPALCRQLRLEWRRCIRRRSSITMEFANAVAAST